MRTLPPTFASTSAVKTTHTQRMPKKKNMISSTFIPIFFLRFFVFFFYFFMCCTIVIFLTRFTGLFPCAQKKKEIHSFRSTWYPTFFWVRSRFMFFFFFSEFFQLCSWFKVFFLFSFTWYSGLLWISFVFRLQSLYTFFLFVSSMCFFFVSALVPEFVFHPFRTFSINWIWICVCVCVLLFFLGVWFLRKILNFFFCCCCCSTSSVIFFVCRCYSP